MNISCVLFYIHVFVHAYKLLGTFLKSYIVFNYNIIIMIRLYEDCDSHVHVHVHIILCMSYVLVYMNYECSLIAVARVESFSLF